MIDDWGLMIAVFGIWSFRPTIINRLSSIQKRLKLCFNLAICKGIDAQGMLIAGSGADPATLAGYVDDMDLPPLFGSPDLQCPIGAKRNAEPATPACVFVGQNGNDRFHHNRPLG
jgi:hypothetical protein